MHCPWHAKPLLAVAGTWQAVFVARFADRLGKGIRTAPRDALIAASVDERQRGDAFGFQRAGDTLGAFLGIGLAIVVVYLTQQQSTLLNSTTFRTIVWLSIIPIAIAVVVLAIWSAGDPQPACSWQCAPATVASRF